MTSVTTAKMRRVYDVKIVNADVSVASSDVGKASVYISVGGAWSRSLFLHGDTEVRHLIEALQDYLIAKHELAQEHGQ